MKIQTKAGELNLELDGIGKNGKINFIGGVSIYLEAIENWLDVLVEFAKDVLCFDDAAIVGRGISLKENLRVSFDDIDGGITDSIGRIYQFVDAIHIAGVYVDEIVYSILPNNEALKVEMQLSLAE